MKKQIDTPKIILFILFGITLTFILVYFFFGPIDYTEEYIKRILSGKIKNPLINIGLTNQTSTQNFSVNDSISYFSSLNTRLSNISEENFSNLMKESINYALIYIKAYNLHNIPFTSNTPKIQFFVGNKSYKSEIIKGEIYTNDGQINNQDITIKTSKEEILKMTLDEDYIQESINSGKSQMELNADKITLFFKGYNNLDLNL